MTCSASFNRQTALRWVCLQDLKLPESLIRLLEEKWPYERTDFGGGVSIISLEDLESKSLQDLERIEGIGPARAKRIQEAVKLAQSERPFGF